MHRITRLVSRNENSGAERSCKSIKRNPCGTTVAKGSRRKAHGLGSIEGLFHAPYALRLMPVGDFKYI